MENSKSFRSDANTRCGEKHEQADKRCLDSIDIGQIALAKRRKQTLVERLQKETEQLYFKEIEDFRLRELDEQRRLAFQEGHCLNVSLGHREKNRDGSLDNKATPDRLARISEHTEVQPRRIGTDCTMDKTDGQQPQKQRPQEPHQQGKLTKQQPQQETKQDRQQGTDFPTTKTKPATPGPVEVQMVTHEKRRSRKSPTKAEAKKVEDVNIEATSQSQPGRQTTGHQSVTGASRKGHPADKRVQPTTQQRGQAPEQKPARQTPDQQHVPDPQPVDSQRAQARHAAHGGSPPPDKPQSQKNEASNTNEAQRVVTPSGGDHTQATDVGTGDILTDKHNLESVQKERGSNAETKTNLFSETKSCNVKSVLSPGNETSTEILTLAEQRLKGLAQERQRELARQQRSKVERLRQAKQEQERLRQSRQQQEEERSREMQWEQDQYSEQDRQRREALMRSQAAAKRANTHH